MRVREQFRFPEDKQEKVRKARRLEYWTIFFLLTITVVMFYTMGSSQAMRTAWIEDVLSLIPPIIFLIASHHRGTVFAPIGRLRGYRPTYDRFLRPAYWSRHPGR